MNFFEILERSLGAFFILLLLTRVLGKTQLNHSTAFNYATGITLGSITANIVIDKNISIFQGFVSLGIWTTATLFIGYLSLKSSRARTILNGEPSIIIKKGKIVEKAMRSSKLNMDTLKMLLRCNHIFAIEDVDYAILETDGQLAVLKKSGRQTVTRRDIQVTSAEPVYLPSEIIVDGKIVAHNLEELNLTREWVQTQIKNFGINSINDVFYAELQSDGTLHIDKREIY